MQYGAALLDIFFHHHEKTMQQRRKTLTLPIALQLSAERARAAQPPIKSVAGGTPHVRNWDNNKDMWKRRKDA